MPTKIQDMLDHCKVEKTIRLGIMLILKHLTNEMLGLEQISYLMSGEINQDSVEKNSTNVSCKDIALVEMCGISYSSLEEGNEHGEGNHLIESTPKCLS